MTDVERVFKHCKQGAVNVITGSVPLTAEYLDALSAALEECLADGQPKAVLDLQDATLLDSAGLEALLEAQENFDSRSGTLKLASPKPLCREILTATGVAHQFEVYRDVKSAVGSFLQ